MIGFPDARAPDLVGDVTIYWVVKQGPVGTPVVVVSRGRGLYGDAKK